jgi:predicted ATPase
VIIRLRSKPPHVKKDVYIGGAMAPLKRIKIRGFKSIRNLDIELGKLNVFIGTNGAGKSNLLEAVGLLSALTSGEISYPQLAWRGMRLSTPEVMRTSLKNYDRPKQSRLEAHMESLCYEVNFFTSTTERLVIYHTERLSSITESKDIASRNNRAAYVLKQAIWGKFSDQKSYDANKVSEKSIVPIAEALDATRLIQNDLDSLRNFAIYSPSSPILRGVAEDRSGRTPLGLYGGGMAQAMRDIFKFRKSRILYSLLNDLEWISSVGYGPPDPKVQSQHVISNTVVRYKDRFMKRNFNMLYAYDISEGALFVTFVFLLLLHENTPQKIALDNIDNALNPGLEQNEVSKLARLIVDDNSRQILLTTHNPTTLDAIDIFDNDHRLFVVERDEDGATVARRIAPPNGITKQDWEDEFKGMRLSQIWLSGAMGALPPKNL